VNESALAYFPMQKADERRPRPLPDYSLELGNYPAWLWADEIAICQELGCEMLEHEMELEEHELVQWGETSVCVGLLHAPHGETRDPAYAPGGARSDPVALTLPVTHE